ncbi:hypothetical protein [Streptomyces sp. HNM0574]|uniref:hypothetical protein n=1 Tax=Streptomyces sp. HNM0574 TaxID=2714954 RepID=UPI001469E6FA|nr:hypothetical protein [Streptomyces sp. HNM0574]NLU68253.1 hypothetical protein [Streptomyces sp. HNM0574]
MRRTCQSLAVAAGLLVSAVAVPVATASPASAATAHCKDYLKREGYTVGAKVSRSCAVGSLGKQYASSCVDMLKSLDVWTSQAKRACYYAWHE